MKLETKELKVITKKLALILQTDPCFKEVNIKTTEESVIFSLSSGETNVRLRLVSTQETPLEATVATKAFIDIVNGLTGDVITLDTDDSVLKVSSGRSKYKLPLMMTDGKPRIPTPITLSFIEQSFNIKTTDLKSVTAINSQEFSRVSEAKVARPANALYYLTNVGCFTAANSAAACLNLFSNEAIFELLLKKALVKLFNLFDEDEVLVQTNSVTEHNLTKTIASFSSETTVVTSYLPADPRIKSAVLMMYNTIRQLVSSVYQNVIIIKTEEFSGAIARLATAAKYTGSLSDNGYIVTMTVDATGIELSDATGNTEKLDYEQDTTLVGTYSVNMSVSTMKLILDLCEEETFIIRANAFSPYIVEFGQVRYVAAPIRN